MALAVPLIDPRRAAHELGWIPVHGALETLDELIDGLRVGTDFDTPPLARRTSGPLRIRELLGGVGARQ
jgi:UDP-glucose 4-epimerase